MAKSLFNKVAGLRSTTLLKKTTLAQVFSCEFCEIFKSKIFCYYKELWRPRSSERSYNTTAKTEKVV